MLIAYASRTGNVKRFVNKTHFKNHQIEEGSLINESYVLVTYTDLKGQVPQRVKDFLSLNKENLVAVASSGNRNWGSNFARSADLISMQYGVPILHKFELSGTPKDIKYFIERVEELSDG